MDLDELQKELHRWRQLNFPNGNSTQQLLGVAEELGELSHAHLKEMQGIRGDSNLHILEAQDAVGDLVIYLMGYCSYRGWHLSGIIETTAEQVLKRDWVKDPMTGNAN